MEERGPQVIMVYGWPELWYSWRHQIKPIAAAGYRVIAPDIRGYGGSAKPAPRGNLRYGYIGLIDAMGEDKAILIKSSFFPF